MSLLHQRKPRPWYLQLHWQIIAGLAAGLVFGIVAATNQWGQFTAHWVTPFGTIFINLLKMVAVPLIFCSLITGVASLSDIQKLSRIGGKTLAIYIGTTLVAITIGLIVVNAMQPGKRLPPEVSQQLRDTYQAEADTSATQARETAERGPLQPLVDIVPQNLFFAASNNRLMLQVVFVALLLGIGLIQVQNKETRAVARFFAGFNDIIIHVVGLVMLVAPIGVFALIAGTITSIAKDDLQSIIDLLGALGFYCLAVIMGLFIHIVLVYSLLIRFFSPLSLRQFIAGITPAQLVAFSSSSSSATLPLTMERCQDHLGVSEEVSSFVLPLGATINMDGTALYQSVAAVFIAQSLGMGLGIGDQLTIVFTALLASIGSAGVPGAGIIMLVIILEAIGVPSAGIALIFGVDRILDMLRTATNVTGDCTVAVLVAASENQLTPIEAD